MSAELSDLELLRRLVAIDTTSSVSNRAIIDIICNYLDASGHRLIRQSYDANGVEKVNLLVRTGPASDSADGLLLSGHVDTVPAVEPDWSADPWTLTQRDGRLCGRGAVDMKGFVALAVNRLRKARGLPRPLALLLTADEEVGCLGAQRFSRAWQNDQPLPRACLVGEPTGQRIVRMHKGHLKLKIRVTGRPAHSGYPHLGVNAIELATDVLTVLRALAAEWREQRRPTSVFFPDCPYPVLNIAKLQAGTAVNVVPAACEIEFGVRVLPGDTSGAAVDEIHAALGGLRPEVRAALDFSITNDSPPLLCDENAAFHRELSALLDQHESIGVSYASDAGELQRLGLDCLLCGPGDIADAHKADEFIEQAAFEAGGATLDRIIQRFCAA